MRVVRYVGPQCRDQRYRDSLRRHVVIDSAGDRPNTRFHTKVDGVLTHVPLTEDGWDLIDVAASVYLADELTARNEARDAWARSIDLIVPVHNRRTWRSADQELRDGLAFLSGDDITFQWLRRGALPRRRIHRRRLSMSPDVVCLFSGGVDSLLGAARLLKEGRSVLLIGHQADSETSSAQTRIAEQLSRSYQQSCGLLQFGIARARSVNPQFPLPSKCENTHRTRSFLFLSIAVAVAQSLGVELVAIPENGLIALNPPLQISRVGSLSTRTAHPRFLTSFARFVELLGVYERKLVNPFMFESKTDMLRDLDKSLRRLVTMSVSCVRPSRNKHKGVRHCGYCVPCLYRRVALMEARLDRPADYAFNVFRDLGRMSRRTQTDFRALVAFAHAVCNSSVAERQSLVVSNGFFSPAEAAALADQALTTFAPWGDMLLRWAKDFVDKYEHLSSRRVRGLVGF